MLKIILITFLLFAAQISLNNALAQPPKSDLPPGWEQPTPIPPGAVRLEDVKPGVTKPKPIQLEEPVTPYVPPSEPAPYIPKPEASAEKVKSDLPPGWEQPTPIPPGAVRLEDVKSAKKPITEAEVTKPTTEAKPTKKEAQTSEEEVEQKLYQRWGM